VSAEARPDRDPVGRDRLHRLRRPRHYPPLEGFHDRSRQVQNHSLLNLYHKLFRLSFKSKTTGRTKLLLNKFVRLFEDRSESVINGKWFCQGHIIRC
jgi:hypothetical protein